MSKYIKYRSELDGLRGISIILVVLFHSFPSICPNGFMGVDIFFVISGYLITSILLATQDRPVKLILDFYCRRINRIFPSLLIIFATCLLCGYLVLSLDEFKDVAKSISYASLFSSNYLFYHQSGYFDNSPDLKPLLNTWSLSIEEQYYIFFPIFFVLLRNYKNLFLIFILIISFSINIIYSLENPNADFLLLYSRAWEIIFGSLLATLNIADILKTKKINTNLQCLVGAICILVPLLFLIKPNHGLDFLVYPS